MKTYFSGVGEGAHSPGPPTSVNLNALTHIYLYLRVSEFNEAVVCAKHIQIPPTSTAFGDWSNSEIWGFVHALVYVRPCAYLYMIIKKKGKKYLKKAIQKKIRRGRSGWFIKQWVRETSWENLSKSYKNIYKIVKWMERDECLDGSNYRRKSLAETKSYDRWTNLEGIIGKKNKFDRQKKGKP